MALEHKPHKLMIELSPELSQMLRAEAERRSTIARKATLASVVRELIVEHCTVRELTA